MEFPIRIFFSEQNRYRAEVPDLVECHANGPSVARALTDVHLAIEVRLAELLGKGQSVPVPRTLDECRQSALQGGETSGEWFLVHINRDHLHAVATHQTGRWG
jgi:predicted RNase H-like HicB family nuclease